MVHLRSSQSSQEAQLQRLFAISVFLEPRFHSVSTSPPLWIIGENLRLLRVSAFREIPMDGLDKFKVAGFHGFLAASAYTLPK